MDLVVTDSWGLPERTYVSIRVGGTRLQRPYRPNEKFFFPTSHHSTVKVDLFQYLGSSHVPLYSLQSEDDFDDPSHDVKIVTDGSTHDDMGLKMKCIIQDDDDQFSPVAGGATGAMGKSTRQKQAERRENAVKATKYLDEFGIQKTLQAMMHNLLEEQPSDPIGFMQGFLHAQTLESQVQMFGEQEEEDEYVPAAEWKKDETFDDEKSKALHGVSIYETAPNPTMNRD